MKLSEALWGSCVRQIEEEGGGALLLKVPVVEDEKKGDGAYPWDLLDWEYTRKKIGPASGASYIRGVVGER